MENQRVSDWARVVREIETGYRWTIYDYLNDLDTRVLLGGSSNAHGSVADEMQVWDDRFVAATQDGQDIELLHGHFTSDFRWLARIPSNLIGELAVDIDSEPRR